MSIYPYLGTNVDPTNVNEVHYRGLLEEGETLMALFDGVLIDERGRRIGGVSLTDFVALTDQRLITWARGFFNDTVDGFYWKDVDVVESKTWDPLHGRVIVAFRLVQSAPRPRRISIKGFKTSGGAQNQEGERILINTFDYMPAADVPVLTDMIGWIGDQVVSGITGEELLAAFADTFPLPDIDTSMPQPEPASQPQPSALESRSSSKKSWWAFGGKQGDEDRTDLADNPDKLIAAYEVQRSGDEAGMQDLMASSSRMGPVPTALGQFGFYDVSRGMRLIFEGPRRVGTSLNRVNDMLVDTAELIEDLQDPKMRKRTISGLRFAMDMQEQQSGLLGAVAPVVRAMLGGSSNDESDSRQSSAGESGERSSVRRIQVRAAVRQREQSSQPDAGPDRASAQGDDVAESEQFSRREREVSGASAPSRPQTRRPVVTRRASTKGTVNGADQGEPDSTSSSGGSGDDVQSPAQEEGVEGNMAQQRRAGSDEK
jgi:hypothetical protein